VFESSAVLDGEDGVSVQGYVGIIIIRGGGRDRFTGRLPCPRLPLNIKQTKEHSRMERSSFCEAAISGLASARNNFTRSLCTKVVSEAVVF